MKSVHYRCFRIAAAVLFLGVTPASLWADLYGFQNVTGNSATNAAMGEAQLQMDVTSLSATQVEFSFTNIGPGASSITDIYFDNAGGKLMSFGALTNGTGVNFSPGASPPDLPGGNTLSPSFHADFGADSNAPTAPNGINPNETLGIAFNLTSGVTFDDIIASLENASLRVGLHVQAFANGGSEAFVNRMHLVPVPSACLMGAFGLAVVGWFRRRRPA